MPLPSSPEVMQIRDLLHTEPAELTATHRTRHVVAAPIVHLDDVSTATRARLDVISYGGKSTGSSWTLCCEYEESMRGFSLWIETLGFCGGRTPSLIADKAGMVVSLVYLQSKKITLMRQMPPKPFA